MIKLESFSYALDNKLILNDINININQGEKVALLGPSGAGKSTLLMALYQQLGQQAALCPQQLGLVDALSVYHNIYMGQLNNHPALYNLWNLLVPIAKHRNAITQLSDSLGIGQLLWKPAAQLSGGERQRVAIGRALYKKQRIFIGDEPITGLDPTRSEFALNAILAAHKTVIVALHDPQLALAKFDRIVGLHNGKIIFDRPSASTPDEQLQHFYRNGLV